MAAWCCARSGRWRAMRTGLRPGLAGPSSRPATGALTLRPADRRPRPRPRGRRARHGRRDRLAVDLDLEALTDSPTNRIGLVALHPPQLAGTTLQVTHPRAPSRSCPSPSRSGPHQPAKDIASLAWETDGVPLARPRRRGVRDGDQRNWTDASYKTYSRPLDLPFPHGGRRGACAAVARADRGRCDADRRDRRGGSTHRSRGRGADLATRRRDARDRHRPPGPRARRS